MGQRNNDDDDERTAPVAKKESVLSRLGDAVPSTKSSDSPRYARTGGNANGNSNSARTVLKENAADINTRTNKRQRIDSSSNDMDGAADRKKRAVAPFTQKDTMARSRRMFGALMGHLGKAKAQIERDTALLERQGSKQHDVARKEQRQAAVGKLEKLIARTEAERTEALARLTQAHAEQLRTSARVAGFLQTVASPPIYYLPAKHTKETADLVAAAAEAHEAKQQRSARAHETQLRERDAAFTRKLELYREQLAQARGTAESGATDEASAAPTAQREDGAATAADKDVSTVAVDDDTAMEPASDSVDDTKAPAADKAEGESAMEEETAEDDAPVATTSETPSEQAATLAAESASADDDCAGPSDDSSKKDKQSVPAAAASGCPSDEGADDTETPVTTEPAVDEASSEPVAATTELETESTMLDVSALKVTELREQLKQRGLDSKGLKAILVARLEAAIEQETAA